jgi:small subunit ribosomal protein S19
MSRSIWKGSYIDDTLFNKVQLNDKNIYTKSRNSVITELFLGKSIFVYNGMMYYKLLITENMLGKKLGEFILSKKKVVFKKKKNKK